MGKSKAEKKPREHYRFESKSTLKQCKDGKWRHKFINDKGNEQTDPTTQIMYTMLISPAFKDLTARQRMLYVYAKSQFYGAVSRPAGDFKDENGNTIEQVNYPLSKANGLPASKTSQPTISTGVNSG